jgi:hypothetical protein
VCRTTIGAPQFATLFAGDAVFVPVPASSPSAGTPWAASRLAFALQQVGLARQVWAGVRRRIGVRRSATALSGAGRRRYMAPTIAEHAAIMAAAALHSPRAADIGDGCQGRVRR